MLTATSTNSVTLKTPQALSELVRDAAARNVSIVDYGVAHTGLGHAPHAEHLALQFRADTPTGLIEHYDRDMTIRAHAGATLGQVQAALAPTKQFLPIDADADLTLGEIVTHHVYGPLRVGYGSVRDHLLGLRYIDGSGEDIGVGGRTVKNAAGLDVTRLMVGSLGELGLISQVTLRTYALPEQVTLVTLDLKNFAELDALLPRWLRTDAAPTGLLLCVNEQGGATLEVRYHGSSLANSVQVTSLEQIIKDQSGLSMRSVTQTTATDDAVAQQSDRTWRRTAPALVRLVVPPAVTAQTVQKLLATKLNIRIDALPGHGTIFVGGALDLNAAGALDRAITPLISSLGFRVWHQKPDASIAPFAPLPTELPMLLQLKRAMDPRNLFNPGRLLRPEHA